MFGFKFIIISIALLSGYVCHSQNTTITITGKVDNLVGRYPVTISKPVDRFFCAENIDINDSVLLEDEHLSAQIDLPSNSFIQLEIQNFGNFQCYIDSVANINFEIMSDSAKKSQYVFFFGANAQANELIANRRLLNPYGRQKDFIEGIIKRAPDAASALDSLSIVLSKYTKPINELYTNQKISANCYSAFVGETEQRFLLCFKDIAVEGIRNPKVVKMSKKEFKTLIINLYREFDPFNKKYFSTPTLSSNIVAKCIVINDGIIPPVITNPKYTWRSYARYLTYATPYVGVYDFAPNSFQQYLIGNTLLATLYYNIPLTKDEFTEIFAVYQQRYPGSPYNSIINERLTAKIFSSYNFSKVKLNIQD